MQLPENIVTESTLRLPASSRTVLRKLEGLLPQIEAGLAQGYSHAVIHAALAELGITVGLPYYYRALHKLRKERRNANDHSVSKSERMNAPSSDMAQINEVQSNAASNDDPKSDDLSVVIGQKSSEQIGNISNERPGIKPFRWRGEDFLNKDWSNF